MCSQYQSPAHQSLHSRCTPWSCATRNQTIPLHSLSLPPCLSSQPQGFQDLGAKDIAGARSMLYSGAMKMEGRTQAAQHEGGIHDMLTWVCARLPES